MGSFAWEYGRLRGQVLPGFLSSVLALVMTHHQTPVPGLQPWQPSELWLCQFLLTMHYLSQVLRESSRNSLGQVTEAAGGAGMATPQLPGCRAEQDPAALDQVVRRQILTIQVAMRFVLISDRG